MNSEDIARYVAGLEDASNRADRRIADLETEVNLRGSRIRHVERERDAARKVTQAPAPDTSRVSFGQRHEGTGMVLLQHAELPREPWGVQKTETAEHHRSCVTDPNVFDKYRAAHAALAEVREALNSAESWGVDVYADGTVTCGSCSSAGADWPQSAPNLRAHRYLAREVQALVDQGLRGDDLNARVPYEVRDHRTVGDLKVDAKSDTVQEADTSSDDEVKELARVIQGADGPAAGDPDTYRRMARAVLAHRARREGGA